MLEQLLLQAGFVVIALVVILGLLVMWAVVSIPVYIAAKLITLGKARFTRAMLVTAAGPIVYGIVFFLARVFLSVTIGQQFLIATISFILAFIAWIGVFKWGFETGWVRAFAIAFVAILVFIIIGAVITAGLHTLVPDTPPITPFPSF